MKKLVILALFVSVSFIACKTEKKETKPEVAEAKTEVAGVEDGVYTAKVEASTLNWKGFKPTGSHDGTVAIKEGSLTISEGKLSGGKFTFDMASIVVSDIPADDKMNTKLVNHLNGADFFDVENNPTSTFEITSVEGETVKGNLTVKGISKPIEFKAVVNEVEGGIELVGETFKIDRTEYNIEYKSKKFFDNLKDKFINDEFEISFKVEASK